MTAPARDRTGFFDLVAQLRSRWAVVVGGGLIGLLAGVAVARVVNAVDGSVVTLVILLIGVVAGLASGFVAGLILVHLQPRVTTAEDVRRVTGLPVVAQLPSSNVDVDDLEDRLAARRLRTSLREAVMNTRSLAGGVLPNRIALARTDTAAESSGVDGGIARALVESGFVPAVVQTDFESREMERPVEAFTYTRPGAAGYQRIEVPDRVASSRPQSRRTEVETLLCSLGERYDVTVAQASSNSFPVALRDLAPVADAVLLVVRSNRTTVEALLSLYGELLSIGVQPLGVVMTSVAGRHRVLLRRTWVAGDFRDPAGSTAPVSTPLPGVVAPFPSRAGFSIADLAATPNARREDQP